MRLFPVGCLVTTFYYAGYRQIRPESTGCRNKHRIIDRIYSIQNRKQFAVYLLSSVHLEFNLVSE